LLVAVAADVVVHVVDSTEGLAESDLEFVRSHPGAVLAWNKIDHPDSAAVPSGWTGVSAATGAGEASLAAAIRSALLDGGKAGTALAAGSIPAGIRIGTERHRAALLGAASALGDAEAAISADEAVDMIAVDVASAIEAIGEISGETTSADVLDSLFSNFCVGK